MTSPRATKAIENGEARTAGRDAIADAGPHLANDDKTIVIPSPNYHPAFKDILRKNGFRFEDGLCPWWERAISKPLNGKSYTAAKWLEWSILRYKWAWPTWEEEES